MERPRYNTLYQAKEVPFTPPPLAPSPNLERKHELEQYLHLIGEEDRFSEVWSNTSLHNPYSVESHTRTNYTSEQKRWIKQVRDQKQDLAPFTHQSDSELHLHHIYAQLYCQAYLGLATYPELINHPANGITLSKRSHVGPYLPGVNHSRHPDVNRAFSLAHQLPDIVKKTFADHLQLAKEGIKYWVDAEDSDMIRIARGRTDKMRALQAERHR